MKSKSSYRHFVLLSAILLCSCGKLNTTDAKLSMGCCGSTLATNEVHSERRPLLEHQLNSLEGATITASTSSPSSTRDTQRKNSLTCQEGPADRVAAGEERSTGHTPTTASAASSSQGQADTFASNISVEMLPTQASIHSQGSKDIMSNPTRAASTKKKKEYSKTKTTNRPQDSASVSNGQKRPTFKRKESSDSVKTAPAIMQVPSQSTGKSWEEENDDKSTKSVATSGSRIRRRGQIDYPKTSKYWKLSTDVEIDESSVGSSLASIPEDGICELSFDEEVAGFFNVIRPAANTRKNISPANENGSVFSMVSMSSFTSQSSLKSSNNRQPIDNNSMGTNNDKSVFSMISVVSTPNDTNKNSINGLNNEQVTENGGIGTDSDKSVFSMISMVSTPNDTNKNSINGLNSEQVIENGSIGTDNDKSVFSMVSMSSGSET